ncbi:MAG TPA: Ig-like domain-containing protein [Beijerinckiaceae bacterium]|nr:Ig-like domain-containing protein [Beijerinckiaceae bacterium]
MYKLGGDNLDALPIVARGGTAVLASAEALFQGQFERVDQHLLITGPSGERFLVRGYFAAAETPLLASPDGAIMLPEAVRSLAGETLADMVAQAGAPAGAAPIGRVDVLSGNANVQRGGSSLRLLVGDPVFKGDVVSTQGASSNLGIKFIDGTVFSLSANARMVLNELVFNPGGSNNSMAANLIQGTFVFVAGQTATNGDMKITTPVATMGIRGTTPVVNINAANGLTVFSIIPDPDSNRIGTYDLLEVLTGRLIRSVSESGRAVVLASAGSVPLDRPYTTAEVATSQTLQAQITSLYRSSLQSPAIDPQQPAPQPDDRTQLVPLNPLVGNIDVAMTDSDRQAIDLAALDKAPKAPTAVQFAGVDAEGADKPSEFVSIGLTVPDPIVLDAIGGPFLLNPLNGGSVTENGQIVFFDLAQGQFGLTISQIQVTASNGGSVAAFLFGTTLAIDPAQFKYLNNGQSLTLSISYSASNGTYVASTSGQLVITGSNDNPVARSDYFAGTAPGDDPGVNAYGNLLSNDTDIDSLGPFRIASVNGIVPNSPIVVHGIRGTLTVQSTTGDFVFVPNSGPANRALSVRDVGSETFYYVVADPEGGQTTGELTVALQGQNDMPIGIDDTNASTAAGIGAAVAATGNLLANDVDYDNGDVLLVTAVDTTPMPSGGVTPITITGYYSITDFYANGSYVSTPKNIWDLSILAVGQFVTETFYYYLADGNGGITNAYLDITINGANDAPVAADDSGSIIEDDVSTSGSALINDSDIDIPDTLSVTHVNGVAFTGSGSATNALGTLSINDAGNWVFTLNNLSASVQGLLPGEQLLASFGLTVSDNHGATAASNVVIAIDGLNDAPTAVNDIVSGTEDTLATILRTTLFANDIDPDINDTKQLYSLTAISGGSIAFSGGGANINPTAHFSGQGQFGYTLRDGAGVTSFANITIDIAPVADAPTIVLDALAPTPLAVGAAGLVNTTTTHSQYYSAVAALEGGGYVIAWQDGSGLDGSATAVIFRIYDASGNALTNEIIANSYTTGDQYRPSVAAQPGGGFVLTWTSDGQDGSGQAVIGRIFDSTGNPVTAEFQLNTTYANAQTETSVAALDGGGFVVAWNSENNDGSLTGVYVQKFNASGAIVNGELPVNTYTAAEQQNPVVVAQTGGGFAVFWESYNQAGANSFDVFGRFYSSTPTALTGEININSTFAGHQMKVTAAELNSTNIIVVWQSQSQDSDQNGIFGKILNASGTAITSEFAINTTTVNDQMAPSVTALADGGFLVTWASFGQDGSDYGVIGQRFSSNGVMVGSEFVVNTTTLDYQSPNLNETSLAQLNNGTIVIPWDTVISGSTEVAQRLYALTPTGPEDTAINLGTMQFSTPDTDGSETIEVALTGFPVGATFNKGAVDPGNSARWIIDGGDVNALSTIALEMTPPANWNGTFTLTVTANVTDTAVLTTGTVTDTESASAVMNVVVTAVNDAPVANGETVFGFNSYIGTTIQIPYSAIQFNDTDVDDANSVFLNSATSTPANPTFGPGYLEFVQQPLITGPEIITYRVSDAHGALSGYADMTFQDSDDLTVMAGNTGDDIFITELAFAEEMTGGAGRDVFVFQMDTMNGASALDYTEGEDAIWVPVAAGAIGSGSLDDFVRVLNGSLEVDLDGTGSGYAWQWIGDLNGVATGTNDNIAVLLDDSSSSFRGEIIAQFL